MITIIQNAISNDEIKELLDYWDSNIDKISRPTNLYSNYTAKYDGISLLDNLNDFTFLKRIRYSNYDKIRIQKVDNTIPMDGIPHTHRMPYTYVVFLNEEFDGGDLLFDNIRIKPKKGQLVYFNNLELHTVENVTKGNRFTLVGFLNDNNFKPTGLNII